MTHTTVFQTAEFISLFASAMLQIVHITSEWVLLHKHCKLSIIVFLLYFSDRPLAKILKICACEKINIKIK